MSGQHLSMIPPGFEKLTIEDQIDYVHSLWDRILGSKPVIPVPEWHHSVIRERLASHQENPDDVIPWDTIKAELDDELGESD